MENRTRDIKISFFERNIRLIDKFKEYQINKNLFDTAKRVLKK